MKKNDWILTASTAVYSYLFYQQSLGINFLLFAVLLIVLLLFRDKEVYKNKNWMAAAIGSLLSAACIAYYGNGLSFTANIISLCILAAFSFNAETSIVTSLFFSLYSICASYIFVILDAIKRAHIQKSALDSKPVSVKLMLYLVPVLIALVFFFMYKASNPLFDNFTKKINLDFISAGWIFFTIGGFFLMYGFFYHKTISSIAAKDQLAPDSLYPESIDRKGLFANFLSIDNEKLSGIILLMLLNILLLTVNILDVNFLWFDGTLPKDLSYSAFVHQGTGTLIASIVIAIMIILFYFRGALNFYKGNKLLKVLAYLWILQNAFMIISTAFRNNLYINEYSLTHKRIGVYVWLTLALIGLITTFVKVIKAKSSWYLFRINGWLFYCVMLCACFVNWDVLVTNFNINRAEQKHKSLDKYYLISLSEKNIPQLLALKDSLKNQAETIAEIKNQADDLDDYEMRNGLYRTGYSEANCKPLLDYKVYSFLDEMQKMEWQSFCFEKQRVYKELFQMKNQVKEINLDNYYRQTLKPLEMMSSLQSLYFSNNNLKELPELKMFPVLENLYLNSNRLDSIDYFPVMDHLKILSLTNNNIKKLSLLKNAPNIISLDLSNNPQMDITTLPIFKNLSSLTLNNTNTYDYTVLRKQQNLLELSISGTVINKGTILPALPKLIRLNLQNNQISMNDVNLFECLSGYSNIEYLNLADNRLENLYPITSYFNSKKAAAENGPIQPLFKSLKSLDVSRNNLQSLYHLSAYTGLEELYVSGNSLRETTPLELMINLKILSIANCGIINIDFAGKLKNLQSLDISGNAVTDYTPLYQLKNLKQLNIGSASKQTIEKLKKAMPKTNISAALY